MSGSRIVVVIAAVLALSVGGCVLPIISWITANLAPPKKQKALYELPKSNCILVLATDKSVGGQHESAKRDVTEFLSALLLEHKLTRRVVSYDDLMAFRLATPRFALLTPAEVGKKFGADIVLHVAIEQFSLKDNAGGAWHGKVEAMVQVIDAGGEEERTLWPEDRPAGHPVSVARTPTISSSPTYGNHLAKVLAAQTADGIAKLFYDHKLTGIDARAGKASGGDGQVLQ